MFKEFKRMYRSLFGKPLLIDGLYIYESDDDPFQKKSIAKVLKIKDGYVQYKFGYMYPDGRIQFSHVGSMKVSLFKFGHREMTFGDCGGDSK